jgi:2-oxoisovalerate dehydrogenase E1 component alpha subunit
MDTLALRSAPPPGVLREDGSLDPNQATALSEELAVALYEHMVLARALDQRIVALQREGEIVQHASSIGEEAAIVGAAAAMNDDDWVFLSSREIGAALWRGIPLVAYAHHAFGTALDIGKGRNAPDPPFWKAARVASVSPLVGTQIPHAVGVAWAARMRKADLATLVFFGEGATSTGDFHTGLNFAGVTKAPVVAVCRNNGRTGSGPGFDRAPAGAGDAPSSGFDRAPAGAGDAPSSGFDRAPAGAGDAPSQTASAGFAIKAIAYGLQGVQVDGGDVVAVLGVVREARRRAASGLGGTLVEAIVPRIDAAGTADAGDPIARMRRHLESRALWSADREQHLLAEVRTDIDRAMAEAAECEKSAPETLFDDVYAELPWHLREQRGEA